MTKLDLDDAVDLLRTVKVRLSDQSEQIQKLRTLVNKQGQAICKLDGGHDYKEFSEWEDHWIGQEFVPDGRTLKCVNCGAEKTE